jgi:hypothetical protein
LWKVLTAVIVKIFTRRLSRRLMVVLVVGRFVLTYDDLKSICHKSDDALRVCSTVMSPYMSEMGQKAKS